jgi:acetylglutamate kinase
MVKQLIEQAVVLVDQALPYAQAFRGATFVIKYGGKAMITDTLKQSVTRDIALLKAFGINPVVVHGGGPEITRRMKKARLKPTFVNGLRVTDAATIRIVRDVFLEINNEIADRLRGHDTKSQRVAGCLTAKQKNADLGMVGTLTRVDKKKIRAVLDRGAVPVISPIATDGKRSYNINADTAATEIAIALRARKLTILSDVDGVLEDGALVSHLSIALARRHIKRGVITGGMIPKVEACIRAVEAGVPKAHLINGTVAHSLLFEIFTDTGVGTEIVSRR